MEEKIEDHIFGIIMKYIITSKKLKVDFIAESLMAEEIADIFRKFNLWCFLKVKCIPEPLRYELKDKSLLDFYDSDALFNYWWNEIRNK